MELGLIQFLTFQVRDRWVCISWKRRSCRGASVPDWLASWRLKSRDGIDEPPFAVRAFGRSRQASSGLLREVWRQRPFPRFRRFDSVRLTSSKAHWRSETIAIAAALFCNFAQRLSTPTACVRGSLVDRSFKYSRALRLSQSRISQFHSCESCL